MSKINTSCDGLAFLQITLGGARNPEGLRSRILLSRRYGALQQHIRAKHHEACCICARPAKDVHHIIPRREALAFYEGWPHHPDNLMILCTSCNGEATQDDWLTPAVCFLIKKRLAHCEAGKLVTPSTVSTGTGHLNVAGQRIYYWPDVRAMSSGAHQETYQRSLSDRFLDAEVRRSLNLSGPMGDVRKIQIFNALLKQHPHLTNDINLKKTFINSVGNDELHAKINYRWEYALATVGYEQKSFTNVDDSHLGRLCASRSAKSEIDAVKAQFKATTLCSPEVGDATAYYQYKTDAFYAAWASLTENKVDEALKISRLALNSLDLQWLPTERFHFGIRGYALLQSYQMTHSPADLMNALWCLSAAWNAMGSGNLATMDQAGWLVLWYAQALLAAGLHQSAVALAAYFETRYNDLFRWKFNLNAREEVFHLLRPTVSSKTKAVISELRAYVKLRNDEFDELLRELGVVTIN